MRISAFVVLVLFGAAISEGSVAQVDQHRKVCDAAQTVTIGKAVLDAKVNIDRAIETFDSPTSSDVQRQTKWFGGLNSSTAAAVKKVYEDALTQANLTQYWCPTGNDLSFKWDVGDLAAVHPSSPGAMFFTPAFFNKSATGLDSQMGIVIHELTHLVGVGLKPEVYGISKSKALALNEPAKSRNNSDSFEYYVEDLAFGLP